ncbi:MAG: protein-L-isoaspartate(D-aspartate) O-methyltransferase [Candidatus Latescibacteria bacterium]|nr:protein-L-isoaspartate(D-aspartate) O-methyltransferase [Candidatus Latescibacterota bacterium]
MVMWLLMLLSPEPAVPEPHRPAPDSRAADRRAMVEEVARYDRLASAEMGRPALSPAVLAALGRAPRHLFVPADLQSVAYANNPLPIGHDQTISQPYIVALMTELLETSPGDTVLEVGTGSGYQAAVLAEMGVVVHSIEIVPALARRARRDLAAAGYAGSVIVYEGDGYAGLPDLAPFDGVIVTAAPDHVPEPLLEQLASGGRLVIPVGTAGGHQELLALTKSADGAVHRERVTAVRFVPLTREEDR